MFLELVRKLSRQRPDVAREALRGVGAYARAPRPPQRPARSAIASSGPARLRDHGGAGAPVLLVPSLINPPDILDLDSEVSLADAIAAMGRRSLLLDWGPASDRAELSVSDHVEHLLVPLLRGIGPGATLLGYCLGGTMAIAAANLAPCRDVVTLASPWHFSAYPADAQASLQALWAHSRDAAQALGALPMEVLQAAFWSIDPERTVAKFARFAGLEPQASGARRFIALEDWANEGDPLPYPAARELIEDLFGADLPGSGRWTVAGQAMSDRLDCPLLNLVATRDRIAPAATAPAGETVAIPAGHVGMVVGSARDRLHAELCAFLAPDLAAGSGQG